MSFAIVVVNAGPSTADNITVTDVVPAGTEPEREQRGRHDGEQTGNNVQGTISSLVSGATATLTMVVSMSNANERDAGYTNTGQRDQHHAGPDDDQQRHGR